MSRRQTGGWAGARRGAPPCRLLQRPEGQARGGGSGRQAGLLSSRWRRQRRRRRHCCWLSHSCRPARCGPAAAWPLPWLCSGRPFCARRGLVRVCVGGARLLCAAPCAGCMCTGSHQRGTACKRHTSSCAKRDRHSAGAPLGAAARVAAAPRARALLPCQDRLVVLGVSRVSQGGWQARIPAPASCEPPSRSPLSPLAADARRLARLTGGGGRRGHRCRMTRKSLHTAPGQLAVQCLLMPASMKSSSAFICVMM